MRFKKDDEGGLVLDESGDPIAVSDKGDVIDLSKVVSLSKHERIATERDEYKGQLEGLQARIEELSAKAEGNDALQSQIAEIKAKAETDRAELEGRLSSAATEYALDTALLGAGVEADRLKAARAYVERDKLTIDESGRLSGLDIDALKADHAFLFGPLSTTSSGGDPAGFVESDLSRMDMDAYAKARAS